MPERRNNQEINFDAPAIQELILNARADFYNTYIENRELLERILLDTQSRAMFDDKLIQSMVNDFADCLLFDEETAHDIKKKFFDNFNSYHIASTLERKTSDLISGYFKAQDEFEKDEKIDYLLAYLNILKGKEYEEVIFRPFWLQIGRRENNEETRNFLSKIKESDPRAFDLAGQHFVYFSFEKSRGRSPAEIISGVEIGVKQFEIPDDRKLELIKWNICSCLERGQYDLAINILSNYFPGEVFEQVNEGMTDRLLSALQKMARRPDDNALYQIPDFIKLFLSGYEDKAKQMVLSGYESILKESSSDDFKGASVIQEILSQFDIDTKPVEHAAILRLIGHKSFDTLLKLISAIKVDFRDDDQIKNYARGAFDVIIKDYHSEKERIAWLTVLTEQFLQTDQEFVEKTMKDYLVLEIKKSQTDTIYPYIHIKKALVLVQPFLPDLDKILVQPDMQEEIGKSVINLVFKRASIDDIEEVGKLLTSKNDFDNSIVQGVKKIVTDEHFSAFACDHLDYVMKIDQAFVADTELVYPDELISSFKKIVCNLVEGGSVDRLVETKKLFRHHESQFNTDISDDSLAKFIGNHFHMETGKLSSKINFLYENDFLARNDPHITSIVIKAMMIASNIRYEQDNFSKIYDLLHIFVRHFRENLADKDYVFDIANTFLSLPLMNNEFYQVAAITRALDIRLNEENTNLAIKRFSLHLRQHRNNIETAKFIYERLLPQSTDVKSLAEQAIIDNLTEYTTGHYNAGAIVENNKEILDTWVHTLSDESQEKCQEIALKMIESGNLEDAEKIIGAFLSPDFKNGLKHNYQWNESFIEAARNGILLAISNNQPSQAAYIGNAFFYNEDRLRLLTEDKAQKRAIAQVVGILSTPKREPRGEDDWYEEEDSYLDSDEKIKLIQDYFQIGDVNFDEIKVFPPFDKIIKTYGLKEFGELTDLISEEKEYFGWLVENNEEWCHTGKTLAEAKSLGLSATESHLAQKIGVDLQNISEEDYEELFSEFINIPEWDSPLIYNAFKNGAGTFGFAKMFQFLDRSRTSLHDTFLIFDKIISTIDTHNLDKDKFYHNILVQAKRDGAIYDEGDSYHYLNRIFHNLEIDLPDTLLQAEKYQEIPRVQRLAEKFSTVEDIFSSWSNLKRFHQLSHILGQQEVLKELGSLKELGKDKLYNYVETLAFHEDSDVDMEKVMEFWREPEEFLEEEDRTSDDTLHDLKKPSNYTEIDNLDLSAEELRDSLVEGDIDSIQYFEPFEIVYEIADDSEKFGGKIGSLIRQALGERKSQIPGTAKQPPKLFHKLKNYLDQAGIKISDYISGGKHELSIEQEADLRQLLYDQEVGLNRPNIRRFRAKIYDKSDPNAALVGDDTACCMPFGSGKNNIYTFNPNCGFFALQMETSNPETNEPQWRTIAQSVLTANRDTHKNTEDFLEHLEEANKVSDFLSQDILTESPAVIACDNVEVAPNFGHSKNSGRIIRDIYTDFFQEYLTRFGDLSNTEKERIVIGTGYSDSLTDLPHISNTFLPLAPVAYSDNDNADSYLLSLVGENKSNFWDKAIATDNSVTAKQPKTVPGLNPLTFRDTLSAGFLEGKAYQDRESPLEHVHNLQNTLIAKDINNAQKHRPNLSLKYVDKDNKIRGYLIAYEGKNSDEDDEEENDDKDGENIIYIADLATDLTSQYIGGTLVKGVIELYKREYLDKNNPLPICFEARDKTSYPLVMKHLKSISQDLGINLVIAEDETSYRGGEEIHSVIIRPTPIEIK